METTVRITSNSDSAKHRPYLARYVEESLERFEGHVKRVRVFIEDVNGPKGGADLQCRLIAELYDMPDVVICERASNVRQAVGQAAGRAKHILRQRAKRRQDRLQARVRTADVVPELAFG